MDMSGQHRGEPAEQAADLPTAEANLVDAIALDGAFWVDNVEELQGRFNAWLAQ